MRQLSYPLHKQGSSPHPVAARGLIDTGSDITAIATPILSGLGALVTQQTTTQTVSGQALVQLYRVSLHILDARNPIKPWFTLPTLLVMGLPSTLAFEVLIGMDVLRQCKTQIDGPSGWVHLDF